MTERKSFVWLFKEFRFADRLRHNDGRDGI